MDNGISVLWTISGPADRDVRVSITAIGDDYRAKDRYIFEFRRYGLEALMPELTTLIEEMIRRALQCNVQLQLFS